MTIAQPDVKSSAVETRNTSALAAGERLGRWIDPEEAPPPTGKLILIKYVSPHKPEEPVKIRLCYTNDGLFWNDPFHRYTRWPYLNRAFVWTNLTYFEPIPFIADVKAWLEFPD